MKRRREQQGTVYSDFRVEDGQLQRKRLCKQLGAVTDMTKQQARTEAKNFLAKINAPTLTPETAVTFTAFVESVYLPRTEQRTRPALSTRRKVPTRPTSRSDGEGGQSKPSLPVVVGFTT